VQGSALAMPALDSAANALCKQLSRLQTRAGDLKTIIVRCDQKGAVVAALYTKLEKFTELELPSELKGLRVYHSNPKSPASVATKLLYELGDSTLEDALLGTAFRYDVESFFQVNPPMFEKVVSVIKDTCKALPTLTDMYAGVGTIGLSVASSDVQLIELDPASAEMGKYNAAHSNLKAEVIESSAETAVEHIVSDTPVIFDPPRAGLHDKVLTRVLEERPPTVVYLSCNPATHARDLARLQESYTIEFFEIYNFFPRTPHIETLAILH
jgi:tRNA/tmRNA/rRNA uracil-C5-methylase (TrmA/RlmC/RlmD family)